MASSSPLAFATCGPVITSSPLPSYSPKFASSVASEYASTEKSMLGPFSGRTLPGIQVNKRVNTFTVRPNKVRFEVQPLKKSADGPLYDHRGQQPSQSQGNFPSVSDLTKGGESLATPTTGKNSVSSPNVFTRVQQAYKHQASSQQHCVRIFPLCTTSSFRPIKGTSDLASLPSEPLSDKENSYAPFNAQDQTKPATNSTLTTEQKANPDDAAFNGAISLPLLNLLSLRFNTDRMTVCKPTSVSLTPPEYRPSSNGGSYDGRKRLLPVTIVPTLVNAAVVNHGNVPRDRRSTASSPSISRRQINKQPEEPVTHGRADRFMPMDEKCDASPLPYERCEAQHNFPPERAQIQRSIPPTNQADCYADLANNPQEYVANQCLSEAPTFPTDLSLLTKDTQTTLKENYNLALHGVTSSQGSPTVLPSYSISTYRPSANLLQNEQAETDDANEKMTEMFIPSYLKQNEHIACHERARTATNDVQYSGASTHLRRSVRRRYITGSKNTGTCHLPGFTQGENNLSGGKLGTNISGVLDPSHFQSKKDVIAYIESKLENMAECFTFKSATYQTYLKQFLPRPDDKQRKYIEKVHMFPRIPTSAVEERELQQLRTLQEGMPSGVSAGGRLLGCEGLSIKERLDEILTSLVNKIMFLLVVEHETWYIHAPAREQIREELLEFIWPEAPDLHAFYRDHFSLFIDMRIRHFRDSVARYFRDRPKATSCKTSGQSASYSADDEYSQQTHAPSIATCCGSSGVSDTLMHSAVSPKSSFHTSRGANAAVSSAMHAGSALHGSSPKQFQRTNPNSDASCLVRDICVDVWMHKPYSLNSVTSLTAELPQCDKAQYKEYSAWCSDKKDSAVHQEAVRVNPGCSFPPFLASSSNHFVTHTDGLCHIQHLPSSASGNNTIPSTLSSTPLMVETQEPEVGLIYYGEDNNQKHEAPLYSPRLRRDPESSNGMESANLYLKPAERSVESPLEGTMNTEPSFFSFQIDHKQRIPSTFSPYPSEASLLFSDNSPLWQPHTTAGSPYPLRVIEDPHQTTEVSAATCRSSYLRRSSISPSRRSSERLCTQFNTSSCKPTTLVQRSTTSHPQRYNREPEASLSVDKTPPNSFFSSVESESKGWSISNDACFLNAKATVNANHQHLQTYLNPITCASLPPGCGTSPPFNRTIASAESIEIKRKTSTHFRHPSPGPNKQLNVTGLSLLNDTPSPYDQALNLTSQVTCRIKPEAHDEHTHALFGFSPKTRKEGWKARSCSTSSCSSHSNSDSPKVVHVHSTQPLARPEPLNSSRVTPLLSGDSELPTIYDDTHYVTHTPENFNHYSPDQPKGSLGPTEKRDALAAPFTGLHRHKESASPFESRTPVACPVGLPEKLKKAICVKQDNPPYIEKENSPRARNEERPSDLTPLPSLVLHRNSSVTMGGPLYKSPLECCGQQREVYPHDPLPQTFKTLSPPRDTKIKTDIIVSSQVCSCPPSTSCSRTTGASPKRMKIADISANSSYTMEQQSLSRSSLEETPQNGLTTVQCLEGAQFFETSMKENGVSEFQLTRKNCEGERKRHHNGSLVQFSRPGVSKLGAACSSLSPEQQNFATESTSGDRNCTPLADSNNSSPVNQISSGRTKLLRRFSTRDLPSFHTLSGPASLPASDESFMRRRSSTSSTDPEATHFGYCLEISGQQRLNCDSPYSESQVQCATASRWCTNAEKNKQITCMFKTAKSDSAHCAEEALEQSDNNNTFQPLDDCYALPITEADCSFPNAKSLGHKVLTLGTTQESESLSTGKHKTIVQCQFIIPRDSNASNNDHCQTDNSCALLSPVSKAFDSGSVGRLSPVSEDSTPRFRFPPSGFHEQQFIFSQSPKMAAPDTKSVPHQCVTSSNYMSFNQAPLECGGEPYVHDGNSSYLSPASLFASPSSQTSSGSFSSLAPLPSLDQSVSQLDLGRTEPGFNNNCSIPENVQSLAQQRQNLTSSLTTMTTPSLSENISTQDLFSHLTHREPPTNLFLTATSPCPVATSTFLSLNDRSYNFENRAEMEGFIASEDCNSSPAMTHYVSHALSHNANALHLQDRCGPRFSGMADPLMKTTLPVCIETGRLYTIDSQQYGISCASSQPLQSNVASLFESI